LIMATHDLELANQTDRIISLRGGKLVDNRTLESRKVKVASNE
ncbi:uncharacterized protein METZ01_LOCUS394505, partial [marine metagenome]